MLTRRSHSSGISASMVSGRQLETFEDVGKDLVEAIEVALVFHERRPREIVEILDAIAGDVGADGLEQRQVLFQRHRHFG